MIVFKVLFYMINNIICSDYKIKIKDDKITIVFDRHIYDYKFTNFSNQTVINLSIDFVRRREKNLFVCDSLFPNLFFIDLNIGELKKFNEKISFVFACFTEKNDVLFDFKIDYDLSNIMLSEFHGFGEEILNLKRYKNKKYDVFILSSNVKNLNAIKNSLNYSEKIKSIKPFFSKMLTYKDICFDPKLYSALNKIYNSEQLDSSFLLRMKVAKIGIIDMINSFFIIYSFLFMPSARRFEFYRYFDDCEKKLKRIFAGSVNFIKSARNDIENCNKIDQTLKSDLLELLDHSLSTIHNKLEIIKSCDRSIPHIQIKKELESIDDFVVKVLEKRDSNNQITLDCDKQIIDKFVDLFFLILMEYCEIMESEEALDIYVYYFLEANVVNADCKSKYEFHYDKLIAIKIKEYLRKYEQDKTDFLIFTESNYFKFKLALTIENLLNFFYVWLDTKKTVKIKGNKGGLSEIDSKLMLRTSDLMDKWENMFKLIGELKSLTFANVLNKLSKGYKFNKPKMSNFCEREFNKKVYSQISPFTFDILLLSFSMNDNRFVYKEMSTMFFESYHDPVDYFVCNKRKNNLAFVEEDLVDHKKRKRSLWDEEGISMHDETKRIVEFKEKVFVNDKKRRNLTCDSQKLQSFNYPIRKSLWNDIQVLVNYNKRNKLTDDDRTLAYVKERKLVDIDYCVHVNDKEGKECLVGSDNKRKISTEDNEEVHLANNKKKKLSVSNKVFVNEKEKTLKEDSGETYMNNIDENPNNEGKLRCENDEEKSLTEDYEESQLDSYEEVLINDKGEYLTEDNEEGQLDSYEEVLINDKGECLTEDYEEGQLDNYDEVSINDKNLKFISDDQAACKEKNLIDHIVEVIVTDNKMSYVNDFVEILVSEKNLEDDSTKTQKEKNNEIGVCWDYEPTEEYLLKEKYINSAEEVILDDTRKKGNIVHKEKVSDDHFISSTRKIKIAKNNKKILFNYKKPNDFERHKKKIIYLKKKKFLDHNNQMIIDIYREKSLYVKEMVDNYVNYHEIKIDYDELKPIVNEEMEVEYAQYNFVDDNEMIVVDEHINYNQDEKMIIIHEQVNYNQDEKMIIIHEQVNYNQDEKMNVIHEQVNCDQDGKMIVIDEQVNYKDDEKIPIIPNLPYLSDYKMKNMSNLANNDQKILKIDYKINPLHDDKQTGNFIEQNLIDEACQHEFDKNENIENYIEEDIVVDNVVNMVDESLEKNKEPSEYKLRFPDQFKQVAAYTRDYSLIKTEKVMVDNGEASLFDKNDQLLSDEVELSTAVKKENLSRKDTEEDVNSANTSLLKENKFVNNSILNHAVDNEIEEFGFDDEVKSFIVANRSVFVNCMNCENEIEQFVDDDKAVSINEVNLLSFDSQIDSGYTHKHSIYDDKQNYLQDFEQFAINYKENSTEKSTQVVETNERHYLQETEQLGVNFPLNFAYENEQLMNYDERDVLQEIKQFAFGIKVNNSYVTKQLMNYNDVIFIEETKIYPIDFEVSFAREIEQSENHNEQFIIQEVEIFVVDDTVKLAQKGEHSVLDDSNKTTLTDEIEHFVDNTSKQLNQNDLYAFDNKRNFSYKDVCDNEAYYLNQIKKFVADMDENLVNGVITLINNKKKKQSINIFKEISVVVHDQLILSNDSIRFLFYDKVYHIHDIDISLNCFDRISANNDINTLSNDKINHFIRYEEDIKEMSYFKRKLFENINCTNLVCYKRKKALSIYDKDVIYPNTKILDYCNDEKIRDCKKEGFKKFKHVDNLKTELLDIKTLKFFKEVKKTEILKVMKNKSFEGEKITKILVKAKKSDKYNEDSDYVKKVNPGNNRMNKYDKIKEVINMQNLDLKYFKKKDHVNELKENVENENDKKESFASYIKHKKHIEFLILFLIIILLACILCLKIVLAWLEKNNDQE